MLKNQTRNNLDELNQTILEIEEKTQSRRTKKREIKQKPIKLPN